MKKFNLIISFTTSVLFCSCNMGSYYANKRISHHEIFFAQETSAPIENKKEEISCDQINTASFQSENKTISEDLLLEKTEAEKLIEIAYTYPKKKTPGVKTEISRQFVSQKKVKKEKKQESFSSNADDNRGTWILCGIIVVVSVVAGLLTHSILIGLLTAVGIPVLLFLILCIIFFCFGGYYLGD